MVSAVGTGGARRRDSSSTPVAVLAKLTLRSAGVGAERPTAACAGVAGGGGCDDTAAADDDDESAAAGGGRGARRAGIGD